MVRIGRPRRSQQVKVVSLRRPWSTAVATVVVVGVVGVLVLFVLMAFVETSRATSAGSVADVGVGRAVVLAGSIAVLLLFAVRLVGPTPYSRKSRFLPVPLSRELDRIRQTSLFGVGPLMGWSATNPDVAIEQLRGPPPLEAVHDLFRLTAEESEAGVSTDGAGRIPVLVEAGTVPGRIGSPSALPTANHLVERGDTYWSLAVASFQDGGRWREIRDVNVGRVVAPGLVIDEESNLRRGWRIYVPPSEEQASNG